MLQTAKRKSDEKKFSKNLFSIASEELGTRIAKRYTDCSSSIGFIQTKEIIKMTAKAKIKVIKKSEVKIVEPATAVVEKKPKQAAREMVSTVSNWVNEFQQRRREETKQAIESFFSAQPQTNGA